MKRKYEAAFYSFYDTAGMTRHLEQMAQRGWFLERINNWCWIYRRGTPKHLHYTVSYYAKASVFDPAPSEGQQTYAEFCEHAGWQLVAENAKLMIFCNDQDDPVPIFTDPGSELDAITAASKPILVSYGVILVMFVLMLRTLLNNTRQDPIQFLANGPSLFISLAALVMMGYLIFDLANYLLWRRKARRLAEQNQFPTSGGHGRIPLIIFLWITFALVVFGFVFSHHSNQGLFLLLHFLGLLALIFAVNGVRLLMKRKKAEKEFNMLVTLAADFVLAGVLTATLMFGILPKLQALDSASPEGPLLTISQLTGLEQEPWAVHRYQVHSPLLSQYESKEYGETCLFYRVVDVHAPWLKDFCLNWLFENNDSHTPADAAIWGAERAWTLEPNDRYLLSYGNRIVILWPDFALTEGQMQVCGTILCPSHEPLVN